MRRACALACLLVAAALIVGGCGSRAEHDDEGGRDARPRAARAALDASRVPETGRTVLMRSDARAWERAMRVLRRTGAGRVVADELPARGELLRMVLAEAGVGVPADAVLGAWVGDQLMVTSLGSGDVVAALWVRSGAEESAQRAIAAVQREGQLVARRDGEIVWVAPSDEALDAVRTPDARVKLRERAHSALRRRGVLAAGFEPGSLLVAGVDGRGGWVDGVLARSCTNTSLTPRGRVGRARVGSIVAVAGVPRSVALRASEELDRHARLALGSVLGKLPPRMRWLAPAIEHAVHATMRAARSVDRAPTGVASVLRPKLISSNTEASDDLLADDPGFIATVGASGGVERAAWQLWADPARIMHELARGGARHGQDVERVVVSGLLDEVDGLLAWGRCSAHEDAMLVGARLAIARP